MKNIIVKVKDFVNKGSNNFTTAREKAQDKLNKQAGTPIASWTV